MVALDVLKKPGLQPDGDALVPDIGGRDHEELSVEDFVAFVLGELKVIVVIEPDICLFHGCF